LSNNLKNQVDRVPIIATLARILTENVDRIPLTDLYLAHPVLQSVDCPKAFPQLVEKHIVENSAEAKKLVNSIVYAVETLLLLGQKRSSFLVRNMVEWIKQQQLEDGGWHWHPKKDLPKNAQSEVWITLATYNLLARVEEANQLYLKAARDYLSKNLEKVREKARGWSRLAHMKTALQIVRDPEFEQSAKTNADKYLQAAINELKSQQLPNGGWAGSERTKQGGLFQTVMVLDALVQAGLDLSDDCVRRGFAFVIQRMDRLLRAKHNGVLIQALSIFCGMCLRLKLIE